MRPGAAWCGLAAIEAKIVGPGAIRQRVRIEQFGAGLCERGGNFQVKFTGFGIPVERQKPGHVAHAVGTEGKSLACRGLARVCLGVGGPVCAGRLLAKGVDTRRNEQ